MKFVSFLIAASSFGSATNRSSEILKTLSQSYDGSTLKSLITDLILNNNDSKSLTAFVRQAISESDDSIIVWAIKTFPEYSKQIITALGHNIDLILSTELFPLLNLNENRLKMSLLESSEVVSIAEFLEKYILDSTGEGTHIESALNLVLEICETNAKRIRHVLVDADFVWLVKELAIDQRKDSFGKMLLQIVNVIDKRDDAYIDVPPATIVPWLIDRFNVAGLKANPNYLLQGLMEGYHADPQKYLKFVGEAYDYDGISLETKELVSSAFTTTNDVMDLVNSHFFRLLSDVLKGEKLQEPLSALIAILDKVKTFDVTLDGQSMAEAAFDAFVAIVKTDISEQNRLEAQKLVDYFYGMENFKTRVINQVPANLLDKVISFPSNMKVESKWNIVDLFARPNLTIDEQFLKFLLTLSPFLSLPKKLATNLASKDNIRLMESFAKTHGFTFLKLFLNVIDISNCDLAVLSDKRWLFNELQKPFEGEIPFADEKLILIRRLIKAEPTLVDNVSGDFLKSLMKKEERHMKSKATDFLVEIAKTTTKADMKTMIFDFYAEICDYKKLLHTFGAPLIVNVLSERFQTESDEWNKTNFMILWTTISRVDETERLKVYTLVASPAIFQFLVSLFLENSDEELLTVLNTLAPFASHTIDFVDILFPTFVEENASLDGRAAKVNWNSENLMHYFEDKLDEEATQLTTAKVIWTFYFQLLADASNVDATLEERVRIVNMLYKTIGPQCLDVLEIQELHAFIESHRHVHKDMDIDLLKLAVNREKLLLEAEGKVYFQYFDKFVEERIKDLK